MAIGLEETIDHLISLFIAVSVHKAVMGFSLGLNIAQSELSVKSFIMSILFFSLTRYLINIFFSKVKKIVPHSPLGVGIGMAVSNLPSSLSSDIVKGVLHGMAGGTFLYITFFEVLPREINEKGNRLGKAGFVILGYAAICVLIALTH